MKNLINRLLNWFEWNSSKLEKYAPVVLRIGLVMVMLWFGLQQLMNTDAWIAYVPDYAVNMSHMSAGTLVLFNGIFEIVFGLLLAFGWQVRIAALLLSLHLFDIMFTVGYGEIGVRDFGLALALFVVFMNGPDILCIQQKKVIM